MAHGGWLLIILSGYKISLLKMTITYKAKEQGKLDRRIEKIFAPLKDLKHIQVFLHGSWADNSTTAFSDIDDFIIIDDTKLTPSELENLEEILLKVQNEFYRIDPLQHHGHWKIYKSELNDYNNGVIPLFILNESICLVGSNIIEASINHHKTYYTLSNSITGFCKWIDILFKDYFNKSINLYNLKCLVGSVVLLAPLIQQLKGNQIDKKTAILNSNEIFSNKTLKLIHWATDLRKNWSLLTNTKLYNDFTSKQSKVALEEWQQFSEKNAPIIDSHNLSDVKPDKQLVEAFISECIKHLDDNTLIPNNIEEYQKAYKLVEDFAISQNALIVGQFGEIKHPGISDLDIFICFEDLNYQNSQEKIKLFIEHNSNLTYIFTHPPVCVSKSMLPFVPYVHTMNNLKITYNRNNHTFEQDKSTSYNSTLNILWTIFILPGLAEQATVASKTGLRDLLLRLKNAHTSIDNLNAITKTSSNAVEQSCVLRDSAFSDIKMTREKVEEEVSDVYKSLALFKLQHTNKYCIIGRKLILKEGQYSTARDGHITVVSMPPVLYKALKAFFYRSDSNINLYSNAFHSLEKIAKQLEAKTPAVFLLRQYKDIDRPSALKKIIFIILSCLPYSFIRKVL